MTNTRLFAGVWPLTAALVVAALACAWALVGAPVQAALARPIEPGVFDAERMVLWHATLPRLAMAALCGGALAASGAVLQQVLRNPLASPTTLGVDAGARLALAAAALFAPGLFGWSRDLVALAGSALSTGLVFLIVRRGGFSSMSVIIAGLVVSLFCGALAAMLALIEARQLASLYIWGAGSLSQQSWAPFTGLLWRTLALGAVILLLLRPLSLMEIGDEGARALGLSPTQVRLAAIAVAVMLSAFVASAVGVIGFISLVAPILARLAGARRFSAVLLSSVLLGAALLLLIDATLQLVAGQSADFLPTGALTAVLGSPLLLALLPRLRAAMRPTPERAAFHAARSTLLLHIVAIASVLMVFAFLIGRDALGDWQIGAVAWSDLTAWRAPRTLAAAAAGALLALAGLVLQRLTGNELVSPEVLGVSAGAILAVALALFAFTDLGALGLSVSAAIGALAVLVLILLLARGAGFQPDTVLLAGVALSALIDSLVGVLSASGDPRAFQLLGWLAGSTNSASAADASFALLMMAFAVVAALLAHRWLALLPLGEASAAALGVNVPRARLALLLIAAIATAAATPILGPVTFIGLMAPHIAAGLGFRAARTSLVAVALIGAALMACADALARTIAFPLQLPTGLLAAMIGAPFLMFLLNRRESR